jgi:hypothetical protein
MLRYQTNTSRWYIKAINVAQTRFNSNLMVSLSVIGFFWEGHFRSNPALNARLILF